MLLALEFRKTKFFFDVSPNPLSYPTYPTYRAILPILSYYPIIPIPSLTYPLLPIPYPLSYLSPIPIPDTLFLNIFLFLC